MTKRFLIGLQFFLIIVVAIVVIVYCFTDKEEGDEKGQRRLTKTRYFRLSTKNYREATSPSSKTTTSKAPTNPCQEKQSGRGNHHTATTTDEG